MLVDLGGKNRQLISRRRNGSTGTSLNTIKSVLPAVSLDCYTHS